VLRQAFVVTAGGKRRLERFYDPRVVRHASFSANTRYHFVGANAWAQLGWDGQLQNMPCVSGAFVGQTSTAQPDPHAAWCIAVNAAISRLQHMADVTLEQERQLQDAVSCAIRLGLRADEVADATTFLLHKVLVHSQIERHAVVAGWLQEAIAGAASYVDRCAEADTGWWQDVEQGAWLSTVNGSNVEAGHG
jgi:hypothetical protein